MSLSPFPTRHAREGGHPRPSFTVPFTKHVMAGLDPAIQAFSKLKMRFRFLTLITLFTSSLPFIPPASGMSTIPFVGCPADSDAGKIVPTGSPISANIPLVVASHLAFYVSFNLSVLGPRGWACSGYQAGNINRLDVYPTGSNGGKPPDIEVTHNDNIYFPIRLGLYFPKIIGTEAIKENALDFNETEKQFVVPQFPDDRLTYLNSWAFEFVTPPDKIGLGNQIVFLPKSPEFSDYGIISIPQVGDSEVFAVGIQLPKTFIDLLPYIENFSKTCLLKGLENQACTQDQN